MIDREARDRLRLCIEDYLDGLIAPGEFVKQCREIIEGTNDRLVRQIDWWTCELYDDWPYRFAYTDRFGWKLLNRYRLLLASEAEIDHICIRRCGIRQPLSLAAILGLIAGLVLLNGNLGAFLYVYFVFTVVVWGLFAWRSWVWGKIEYENPVSKAYTNNSSYETFPFDSFGPILALKRTVPGFACRKYDKKHEKSQKLSFLQRLGGVEIHILPQRLEKVLSPILGKIMAAIFIPVGIILFAPLLAIYMVFPETYTDDRLKLP